MNPSRWRSEDLTLARNRKPLGPLQAFAKRAINVLPWK